jgi:hypothetical protein
MAIYHSSVATICNPRYKLQYFEFLYKVQGGANAIAVKKAKSYFEHVFSDYNRRAIRIKEYERQQAENVTIDVREAREERSITLEVEGQEDWRVNPTYSYSAYIARRPRRPVVSANSLNSEIAWWLGEECLLENSTPEQVKDYI